MTGLMDIKLPTLKEAFVGEIAQPGHWLVACVRSGGAWPIAVSKVRYKERYLFLIPPTINEGHPPFQTFPAVALPLHTGERMEAGQTLISQFLSSLTWVSGHPLQVDEWTGGNLPRPMSGYSGTPQLTRTLHAPYLPEPTNRNACLALAFYREGLSLNHAGYQCLSFFKVLNIFLRSGPQQRDWINSHLNRLEGERGKRRAALLAEKEGDVGHYLYGSNRCAIAHAGLDPTADPEDPVDMRRLRDDLPLVQALAEHAIEYEFGIKSSTTIYREHLYELEGFRSIFGAERTQIIKRLNALPNEDHPKLPTISIRLAHHERYGALESLSAQIRNIDQGRVRVWCKSADGFTEILLSLNFVDERLEFDIHSDVGSRDDGSELAARQAAIVERFRLDYIMNGILEVWDVDANQMLSRRDAYLPTNVDMQATHQNFERAIRLLEAEANRRSLAESEG